jgi:hypothetical protein
VTFDLNFYLALAGLVVATVAVILALPPLLQMMRGGPLVKIAFDATVEQDTQFLLCKIFNLPVRNWLLRKLGVARAATDVFASFDIREHGTNKIIANSFRASLSDTKSHATGLTLTIKPPLPVIFTVVAHDAKGALCEDHAPGQPQRLLLQPGEYFADVKIGWGEMTVRQVAQSFTVAGDKFATHWTARKIVENW